MLNVQRFEPPTNHPAASASHQFLMVATAIVCRHAMLPGREISVSFP